MVLILHCRNFWHFEVFCAAKAIRKALSASQEVFAVAISLYHWYGTSCINTNDCCAHQSKNEKRLAGKTFLYSSTILVLEYVMICQEKVKRKGHNVPPIRLNGRISQKSACPHRSIITKQ